MRWMTQYIPIHFYSESEIGEVAPDFPPRRYRWIAPATVAVTLAAACAISESYLLRSVSALALLFGGLQWRLQSQRLQNLETAVGAMWQGIALFDADERLLLYNRQFGTVCGVPAAAMRHIRRYSDVISTLAAIGRYPNESPEDILAGQRDLIAQRRAALFYRQYPDGRLVAVSHQPLPDGGWVRTYADVSNRRRAEDAVIHMARHDSLTDLPNRVLFRERLEQAMHRAVRQDEQVAVLCLDLDGFKAVNDTLGHPTGDALLREVASRLRQGVREDDTVARLGGDEFAIVHVGVHQPADALALARRLIGRIGALYDIDGRRIAVQTCIGITLAPTDGSQVDELLRNADMALYHAKSAGRGIARLFDPTMGAEIVRRQAMELDLREALALGQFHLEYQPIVNLRTWRIESFEALLRWTHPTRGLIGPEEFVPVADKIGLIGLLGEWVLREACAAAVKLPEEVGIAVNLSPLQVRGELIVAAVMEALQTAGLAAERLELEITERVMLQDDTVTRAVLDRLGTLGVRMSMDDFGTGYSSLGALYRFPFHKVKIDRSFVRDLSLRPEALAVLRAVVQLGVNLGIRTTVEGVETTEQLALVRAEGCDCAQGFLFGRPLRAADVADFLAGWRSTGAAFALMSEENGHAPRVAALG